MSLPEKHATIEGALATYERQQKDTVRRLKVAAMIKDVHETELYREEMRVNAEEKLLESQLVDLDIAQAMLQKEQGKLKQERKQGREERQQRKRDIAKHRVQLDRKRNKALEKIASMVEL